MSISNEEIILKYKIAHNLPLSLEMHTFGTWYKMGYKVRKGEKCVHRIEMWKKIEKKNKEERFFLKTMNLFDEKQVDKMEV